MDNTLNVLVTYGTIAAQASVYACIAGVPFGGTVAWVPIVFLSYSERYPHSPLQAIVVGFPTTIVCDIVLLIPALFILYINLIKTFPG